jgi:hypothetical protein
MITKNGIEDAEVPSRFPVDFGATHLAEKAQNVLKSYLPLKACGKE